MPGVRTVVRALVVTTALGAGAANASAAPSSQKSESAKAPPAAAAPKPAARKASEHKPSAHKSEHKPSAHKSEHKPSAHKSEHKPSAHKSEHKPSAHKSEHEASAHKASEHQATARKSEPNANERPGGHETAHAPAVGPGAGAGQRSVAPVAHAEPAKQTQPEPTPPPRPVAESGRKAYQKGRPPRRPNASLPAGAERPQPNDTAREQIAGGPTDDVAKAGADDPELRALDEADHVLFPKVLDGATSGWSWDLPKPVDRGGAEVVASGLPPDVQGKPSAEDEGAAIKAEWLRSLSMPNLPVRLDERVVKYLEFYRDTARGKAIARVWAKKSGRYAPAIKAELAKAGLPTDLVWLSLIESGHNPTIVSPAGAAGLWQFMPEAGRLYGLAVDRWVDERLDPERETEAAIRYLSDLHRRFGNWELAMAAYNMGYGGLSRAIRKFNSNDFWELSRYEAGIPWETTLYVPKILAIAIVMNNKKAFGIDNVTPAAPVGFDTVLVVPGTPMSQVAQAAGTDQSTLAGLNPAYLAERTPPRRPGARKQLWPVHVPRGSAPVATRRLAHVSQDASLEAYVVRFGDTLATIAGARRTSESRIRGVNEIDRDETLVPGTVLLVPRVARSPASADDDKPDVVVVPPRQFSYADRDRIFYRVLPGDTLGRIARAFGATRAEVTAWNSLDRSARLQSGMVLSVFARKGADLSHVRHISESDTRVLVAGSHEFYDYFEAQKGNRRILVTVKSGDTVAGIGKRYGMSVGWMERVNRFSRHKKLKPGDKVVVYTKLASSGSPVADEVKAEPLAPAEPPRPEALPPVAESAATGSPATAAAAAAAPQG